MTAVRILFTCIVRSRCPCCAKGRLFRGWFRFEGGCPECGLCFEPWVGDWITPPYLASTLGMLVAFAACAVMLGSGFGLEGPLPPELLVIILAGGVSLAALRPAKAGWLAFLYWIGGVEVSAETRAHLRWEKSVTGDPEAEGRLRQAEQRARQVRRADACTDPRDLLEHGIRRGKID